MNRDVIDGRWPRRQDFIGGNCTVSLMLMATAGPFRAGLVEWVTAMTYQSASGGGAQQMRELVAQMGGAHDSVETLLADPACAILDIDRAWRTPCVRRPFPRALRPSARREPAALDRQGHGQRPEPRGMEGHCGGQQDSGAAARIGLPVEGICVRVGAMRCHSQALTVKLSRDVPLDEIEAMIASATSGSAWFRTKRKSRCAAHTGSGDRHARGADRPPAEARDGRRVPPAFTVGDQLLWGAAEPLRRMLRILLDAPVGSA